MKQKYFNVFCLWLLAFTIGFSQTLETFETETNSSLTFSEGDGTFVATNNSFRVVGDVNTSFGWNGTAADQRYFENRSSDVNDGAVAGFEIVGGGTFKVISLYTFAATHAFENQTDETLTIEGKNDDITVFTIVKTSGFSDVENFTPNNGFTFIDFATEGTSDFSNIDIDELQFTTTGDWDYFAIDAITFVVPSSNTVPVAVGPTTPIVSEDDTNVALANDIQITDAEGDDQTVTVTVTGGTVTTGGAGITFGGSGNASASFSIQGTLAAINTALDAATFTPTADLFGTDVASISIISNDGTIDSNNASITFSISAVNDVPSFTAGANQMVNEDAGMQTVTDWASAISAGPANESTQTLSFTVTNDNNALFSAQPAIDASGNLTYTPAADATGSATVIVSISDDGGTANGGDDTSADQTFTITVNPINDEPSFTAGANQIVNEDAGMQTVTDWASAISAGPANESTQTLSFTVTNDNNALFSAQPAIDASGNLTYTPAADATGSATVIVSISDDGGTANGGDDTSADQTFTITVNPINDEPSFTAGANEAVNEDAGAQTINGWATVLDDGDAEATQTLSFTVTNDNNALFSVQPAIDASGNLTYTPAADATGSATVTVSISDDGGTANGGDDTSADQTFTITVNQLNDTPVVITSITDDTGNNTSDFVTSDNRFVVNGTAEPGSTVSLFFNGSDTFDTVGVGATTLANAMGVFSYEIPETVMFPFQSAITVLPISDGMLPIKMRSRINGSQLVESAEQIITIDTEDPTVQITSVESSPTSNDPIAITVAFSEEVLNFVVDDIVVTNGVLEDFSTLDNTLFTANIIPDGDGEITVNVAANIAEDIAGNSNEAATQFSIVYDDPTLSNDELELNSETVVIVNPVQEALIINTALGIDKVTVYDLQGRLVLTENSSTNQNEISIDKASLLSSGTYIVRITNSSGTLVKQVVKE